MLVVQSASYNSGRLATVVAVVITSKTGAAAMPGNVFLPTVATGLPRDSVTNVTAIVTINKDYLGYAVGSVPESFMLQVDQGLRQVLEL